MMSQKYVGFLFMTFIGIVFLVSGCVIFRSGSTESWFLGKSARTVAVLDFEQEGFTHDGEIGTFAADELTSKLFIERKLKVVDRALIRAKMADLRFNPQMSDVKEIQTLGMALNADCLILGKITQISNVELESEIEQKKTIQISFRLVSPISGDVIGMISKENSQKGETKKIVSRMIGKMVKAVKL
jgi:hypothetical protein